MELDRCTYVRTLDEEIDRRDTQSLETGSENSNWKLKQLHSDCEVMEPMLRRWGVFLSAFGLLVTSSVIGGVGVAAVAASAGELLVGRLQKLQGRLQQFVACNDPFSLKHENAKGGGLQSDLKILEPKGDSPSAEKKPLCTVSCFRADPVCGSNGVTYWCGDAEAKCAEVDVQHHGYCELWSVGANLGLHATQSLQLVHMVWLVLAVLLIVMGLLS